MDSFQTIVLIIAIVLLTIILIVIGVALYNSKNSNWPPLTPNCPDYWDIDVSGNCTNTKNLGTCPAASGNDHLVMNFSAAPYTGSQGLCAKYTWANNCNVAWDGVNYGVSNPCQSPPPATS